MSEKQEEQGKAPRAALPAPAPIPGSTLLEKEQPWAHGVPAVGSPLSSMRMQGRAGPVPLLGAVGTAAPEAAVLELCLPQVVTGFGSVPSRAGFSCQKLV